MPGKTLYDKIWDAHAVGTDGEVVGPDEVTAVGLGAGDLDRAVERQPQHRRLVRLGHPDDAVRVEREPGASPLRLVGAEIDPVRVWRLDGEDPRDTFARRGEGGRGRSDALEVVA